MLRESSKEEDRRLSICTATNADHKKGKIKEHDQEFSAHLLIKKTEKIQLEMEKTRSNEGFI
jgi:hypothetical protein